MTTNYDINIPGIGKVIADDLVKVIDAEEERKNPPKHSWRVAPSSLADDCTAKLWYKYRWAKLDKIEGRMLRLFRDGSEAEDDFVSILQNNGWTVYDKDPARVERGVKNPQYRIKDFNGHLSGYLDGIGSHPIFTQGLWVLLEFKTFNEKNFKLWRSKGVRESHPKYYGQACLYMKYYNLPWCLMMGKNKNDSEIAFEVIMRNDGYAEELLRKAHTIVNSRSRPGRIAESGAHHKCKYCPMAGVCHYGEPVEISCRSCANCFAVEDGNFACSIYGPIPNEEAIKTACSQHTPIR